MFDVYILNKPLLTPRGKALHVPTLDLANAIAKEWEKDHSPHYQQKPLTSLAATALDCIADQRETYTKAAIEAVPKDGLLFWAATPESLVKRQQEKWTPIIEKVNCTFGLSLKPTTSLSVFSLFPEEIHKIKDILDCQTVFEFAGFMNLLSLTSSFGLSFLLLKGHISPENAWDLAHLHEHEQRRIWGEDEAAILREKSQQKEFFETVRFCDLI